MVNSVNSNDFILKEPTALDKNIVMEYRQECLDAGLLKGVGFLLGTVDTFEEWFDIVQKRKNSPDIQTKYLFIRKSDNKLIGILNIRHSLNDPLLLKYNGNIGSSIRPSERRKGYGSEVLKLGINICKNLNIQSILLICGENNIASKKIIEKCGGVLDKKVPLDDGIIQLRYYINLR